MRRFILSFITAVLTILTAGVVFAQTFSGNTISPISPWVYGSPTPTIQPTISSSSIRIPKLASSGLCVITNASGTLSVASCGGPSATTTISGLNGPNFTVTSTNGIAISTSSPATLLWYVTFPFQIPGSATTTFYGDGTDATFGGGVKIPAGKMFYIDTVGTGLEKYGTSLKILTENSGIVGISGIGGNIAELDTTLLSTTRNLKFPNQAGVFALLSDLANFLSGFGTSTQVAYYNTSSSLTSSPNFTFDGTNLTVAGTSTAGTLKLSGLSNVPQIYANGDNNTGLLFPGPDVLRLITGGGIGSIYIDSTGHIVAGSSTTPDDTFAVVSNGGWPILEVYTSSTPATAFIVANNGKVGVATTTPTYDFVVVGNAGTTGYFNFKDIGSVTTTPPAGTFNIHAETTQGFTRPEVDDEGPTDLVLTRDSVFVAKNTSGVTIATGTPVYVTGSTGNVPNVSSSLSNSVATLPAIGLALNTIANNNFGQVISLGIMDKINTSAFSSGDQLYVSSTASGINLTNVRPSYPNLVQRVGSVLVSGVGNGSIGVTIAPAILGRETGTINPTFNIGGALALTTVTGQTLLAFPLPYASTTHIGLPLPYASTTGFSYATSGAANISIASSTGTWTFSQATSSASINGFLSSADWNTFNAKITTSSLSAAGGLITYNNTTGVFNNSANYVSSTQAGTGIGVTGSVGAVTISNNGVLTVSSTNAASGTLTFAGTADRVTISNSGSAFTLTGPQDIGTGSSPTFNNLSITTNITSNPLLVDGTPGHVSFSGGTPSAGTCGTGPAINASSTDNAGRIRTGASAASNTCTINFAKTWTLPPACMVMPETSVQALRATTTVSTLTWTSGLNSLSSSSYSWVCMGYQ